VNNGAKVINVSYSSTQLTVEEMEDLVNRGFVIVVGAGNGPKHRDNYDVGKIPGVIRVSGVDKFGNHGPTNHAHDDGVELCAMSKNITVASNGNTYINGNGTSFAAPQVSATAALILSINPCYTPAQVEYIIKSTTKPINDASSFPGLVGTGYLDMYEALKKAAGRSGQLATSETWTNDEFIGGNVIIPSGITLTIKGKVLCRPDALFTVKKGGKLILDGCNISGFCDSWKGICVEGTTSKNQQNKADFGFLEMKNNAVIADALNAVRLNGIDNNGDIDWSKIGGLIQASNSEFLNNAQIGRAHV
jgi:subtilisin family serine protease